VLTQDYVIAVSISSGTGLPTPKRTADGVAAAIGRWASRSLRAWAGQWGGPADEPIPHEWKTRREMLRYKMLVMVEGNDVASGLKWALLSSSAVLMPPPTVVSWAMEDLLEPWVHYVPLCQNTSDLPQKAAWCLENGARCAAIGEAGRCFAQQFLDGDRESRIVRGVMRRVLAIMQHRSCATACNTSVFGCCRRTRRGGDHATCRSTRQRE